uniref:EF-hand domain-containing protein n=1 Tax=Tetradesmus obliquus TaxID=3088 RepID=A0A383WDD3_TETOB
MGIISNWFGGSSTAAAQPKTNGPAAATSSKPNVWRSVFDPGSNPNIDRQGSNYYDTVKDPKSSPSTWEMILKAEDFRRRSFGDLDKDKDGYVDAAELKAVVPPSMADKELKAVVPPSMADKVDTAALISQAGATSQGKLTRKEFNEVLDKYFLA